MNPKPWGVAVAVEVLLIAVVGCVITALKGFSVMAWTFLAITAVAFTFLQLRLGKKPSNR